MFESLRLSGKNNVITISKFYEIVDCLTTKYFMKISDKTKLERIYLSINSERTQSINIDKLYGGLALFCCGSFREKIKAAFSNMLSTNFNNEAINYNSLVIFMESTLKILDNFQRTAIKRLKIPIIDLSRITAKRCFEDGKFSLTTNITSSYLIEWLSRNGTWLVPTKRMTLDEFSYPNNPTRVPFNPLGMTYNSLSSPLISNKNKIMENSSAINQNELSPSEKSVNSVRRCKINYKQNDNY